MPRKPGPGRPPGSGQYHHRHVTRVTDAMHHQLHQEAARRGVKISQVIRDAITLYFDPDRQEHPKNLPLDM